jgi:hypothetical protein
MVEGVLIVEAFMVKLCESARRLIGGDESMSFRLTRFCRVEWAVK